MTSWKKSFLAITVIIGAAILTSAQEPGTSVPRTESRTAAEETFELNIAARRITEKDFAAATAVELGPLDQKDLSLQVGVALRAKSIDVVLRNVSGTVRFHGSLQSVLDRLRSRPRVTPPR